MLQCLSIRRAQAFPSMRPFLNILALTAVMLIGAGSQSLLATEPASVRPLMGEFLGVNGHTIQFRPTLYGKVCRKVRDYHSLEWDVGKDTDFATRFPFAWNGVNWDSVYGSWSKAGFETDVCVIFNNTPPDSWKDMSKDAHKYGLQFAKAFGPSSAANLVKSVEIGNEPGDYSDRQYRELFESMARGFREGDPKLQVLTCNMTAGKGGKYEKSVESVAGLDSLYDVLTTHTYAMAEGWPTRRRSYPEDSKTDFLTNVVALLAWRDEHAKEKPVWVKSACVCSDASRSPSPSAARHPHQSPAA